METPTDLPSVAHLHSLSVDIAATLLTITDDHAQFPWHKIKLPAYSALRSKTTNSTNQQQQEEEEEQQQQQPCKDESSDQFPDGCAVPKVNCSPSPSCTSLENMFNTKLHLALPCPSTRSSRQRVLREYRQLKTNSNEQSNKNCDDHQTNNIHSSKISTSISTSSSSDGGLNEIYEKQGILRKRGRRTGIFRKRFFAIGGGILYNFHRQGEQIPSWKLSLTGAHVGTHINTYRIVIVLDQYRKLVLYAKDEEDMYEWANCILRATEMDGEDMDFDYNVIDEKLNRNGKTQHRFKKNVDYSNVQDITHSNASDDVWDSFTSFATLKMRNSRRRGQKINIMNEN